MLRVIHRTQRVLGLRRVLSIVGLSASRLRAWRDAVRGCLLDDQSSCPKSSSKRVLAVTELALSDSMFEAWWRVLKHTWLYLHSLTTATPVRSLVEFDVAEHNSTLPHSAFEGQTPDEMFFGTGAHVSDALATTRVGARQTRLEANRALQ